MNAIQTDYVRRPRFSSSYREDVILRGGKRVKLHLLGPDHAQELRRAFDELSPRTRYLRFFAVKKQLNDRELDYLTRLDGTGHLAIAAAVQTKDGWRGVGVARFVRLPGEVTVAEPAVTVVDDFQGVGLGSVLIDRIIAAAAERGYTTLRAEVLGENRGALSLMRRTGRVVDSQRDGDVITIDLGIADAATDPFVPYTLLDVEPPSSVVGA